jgi:hypothetical protein
MIGRTLIQANTKGVWAGAAAELIAELSAMPDGTKWVAQATHFQPGSEPAVAALPL